MPTLTRIFKGHLFFAGMLTTLVCGMGLVYLGPHSAHAQHASGSDPILLVRDINDPPVHPFTSLIGNETGLPSSFTVPGHRLVIEFVTAGCSTPTGSTAPIQQIGFNATTADGDTNDFFFVPVPTDPSLLFFAVSQSTRIYADPNTTVSFFGPTGSYVCALSISGYLRT